MKPVQLSPRLEVLLDLVPASTGVADVGTDHAYVAMEMIRRKITEKVIGTEIHPGPLDVAKSNVQQAELVDHIDIRSGDGLEPVRPGEVTTVVVAGMGGGTIRDILSRGRAVLESVSTLVLQPMNDFATIRNYLRTNAWRIEQERLVREGQRFYFLLRVGRGQSDPAHPDPVWDEVLQEVGPLLWRDRDPELREYLLEWLQTERHIIGELSSANPERYALDIARRENRQAIGEEMYACLPK